jgi:GMP synthase (glutamine-hydrolysing)
MEYLLTMAVLRKNEFENVLTTYGKLGLNVKGIDAKQRFYDDLQEKLIPKQNEK